MKDSGGFDSNSAWEMFSKTGSIGMYMLYKSLIKQENQDKYL